jgi:hypothetical protein
VNRTLLIVSILGTAWNVRADEIPFEQPTTAGSGGWRATTHMAPESDEAAGVATIGVESFVEPVVETVPDVDGTSLLGSEEIAPITFDPVREDHTVFELAPQMSQATWLIGGPDKLGMFSLQTRDVGGEAKDGLEFLSGYGIHFLDGPGRIDMPPRLFEFHFGIRWRETVDEDWAYELAVTPGIYADFEGSARDGFRVPAHGIVFLGDTDEWPPNTARVAKSGIHAESP